MIFSRRASPSTECNLVTQGANHLGIVGRLFPKPSTRDGWRTGHLEVEGLRRLHATQGRTINDVPTIFEQRIDDWHNGHGCLGATVERVGEPIDHRR